MSYKINESVSANPHSYLIKLFPHLSVKLGSELEDRISDIILPQGVSFSSIVQFSSEQRTEFAHITYPKLSFLSDGTYKLYIDFRLLGGGGGLDSLRGKQVSDNELTKAVKEILPSNSYKSISVTSIKEFDYGWCKKKSRQITLDPHNYLITQLLASLVVFFTGYKKSPTINGTLIRSYFFNELNPDEKKQAEEEIKKYCNEGRKIYIIISDDWEAIEIKFSDAPKSCLIL